MTDQNKPGMPKDKEDTHQKPQQNPNDRHNKDNADKGREDHKKNPDPTHSKE